MTWYPLNSLYSIENFDTFDTGQYIYQDFSGQNNIGGAVSLRNTATGNFVIVPPGEPWPAISWDRIHNFTHIWTSNSGDWLATGLPIYNPVFGTTSLTGVTTISQVELARGEPHTGKSFFGDNVSFNSGVLLEASFFVPRMTGITTGFSNFYGIYMQDGVYSETVRIRNNPMGLQIGTGNPNWFVHVPNINTQRVTFRLGIRGSTGQIITSDGYVVLMTGVALNPIPITKDMGTGKLTIGDLSTEIWRHAAGIPTPVQEDPLSRIELHHLYQKHNVFDIGGDFIADTKYSQNELEFITSSFSPEKIVSKWRGAYIDIAGERIDGYTNIVPEHKNNNISWTTGRTSVFSGTMDTNTGYFIDLTYLDALGDGTDEIRYRIIQRSLLGERPPVAVDRITTILEPKKDNDIFELIPNAVPSEGETPVVISINPASKAHVHQASIVSGNTCFIANFNSTTLIQTGFLDIVSNRTGYTNYPSTGSPFEVYSGVFNTAPKIFRNLKPVITPLDDIFTGGFSSPPIKGVHYTEESVYGGQLVTDIPRTFTLGTGLTQFISRPRINKNNNLFSYWTDIIAFADKLPNAPKPLAYYPIQWTEAYDGIGLQTPRLTGLTSYKNLAIDMIASIEVGAMAISVTGEGYYLTIPTATGSAIYPHERFSTPQRIRTVFPAPTGGFYIQMFGVRDIHEDSMGANITYPQTCRFGVAGMRIRGFNTDGIVWTGNSICTILTGSTEICLDAWVKPDGFFASSGLHTGTTLIRVDNSTGQEFSRLWMDHRGFPAFDTSLKGGKIGTVIARNGIDTQKYYHVLGQYVDRQIPYSGRLEIYVDGKLSNRVDVNTGYSAVTSTNNVVTIGSAQSTGIGSLIGSIDDVRIRRTARNPHQIAVFDAYEAPIKFQTEFQFYSGNIAVKDNVYSGQSPHLLYRFDRGTIVDFSKGQYHAIVPESSGQNLYVERDAEGIVGEGISFLGNKGGCYADLDKNFIASGDFSIFGWLAAIYPGAGFEPRIFGCGNSRLSLHQGSLLKYKIGDSIFTGQNKITSLFAYRWFNIDHKYLPGLKMTIVSGSIGSGNSAYGSDCDWVGYIDGPVVLTGDRIYFGHDPNIITDRGDIYMDEFMIMSGSIPTSNYANFDLHKTKPGEDVFMNNSGVYTGRVFHAGVYAKQVIVPPRTDFSKSGSFIRFKVTTLAGDIDIRTPLLYLGNRYVIPDSQTETLFEDLTSKICKTKSPFRVGWRVPSSAVNMAFLTSPEFSIENNLSYLDGSDSNSENIVNSLKSYMVVDSVTGQTTTGNIRLVYTGQVDTDDILITNASMVRENEDISAPLFYRYNIGNERYFVAQTGGTNNPTGDFNKIISSIRLRRANGSEIGIAEFPWDIRVSKIRKDGFILPYNIFNVEMLTRDRYIPEDTIFVEYVAADPIRGYAPIRGHREVLNPRPLWTRVNVVPFVGETYQTVDAFQARDLSDITYNPGPNITIQHSTTIDWDPTQSQSSPIGVPDEP